MRSAHLLTAAAVLIACGCTESSLGPNNVVGGGPPEPPVPVVITGTIEVSAVAVALRLESGDLVDLVGAQAQRLAPLYGAQVELRGDWAFPVSSTLDTELPIVAVRRAFAATEFLVLSVGGRPAMDGVLEEDEGRYYLRLGTGDVFWLTDVPSDFNKCIGRRIWVTGSMEDPPLTFGLID